MTDSVEKHVEDTLNHIRNIYNDVSVIINALKSGEKVTATGLAVEIAKNYGMSGPQLYPIILPVLKDFPGTKRKRGVQGGIWKL